MSFLSPIVDATYGYPSVGFGWQSFGSSYPVTPFFSSPYVDPYFSYASPIGGRYFYGSLFGPTFGGVSFSPYFDSYHADLLDAGARLLSWGNFIEADPFYMAYNPWFYQPYIPFIPFVPINSPLPYNPAPPAQASQAAQPTSGGVRNEDHRHSVDAESDQPMPTPEQLAQFHEDVKKNEAIVGGTTQQAQTGGRGAAKRKNIRVEDTRK